MSGDFENTRDLLARSECKIHEVRERREREERDAARTQREALEKQAGSGSRRSLVAILNGGNAPDMDVVTRVRALQKLVTEGHNREHARYLARAAGDGEPFDRLSPASRLGRSVSLPRLADGSLDLKRIDRMSRSYGDGRQDTSGKWDTGPESNFNIDGRDPGMPDRSRFEWDQPFVSTLTARKILDAAGKLLQAAREESAGGEVTTPRAEWLLSTANALIAAVNNPKYSQGKV